MNTGPALENRRLRLSSGTSIRRAQVFCIQLGSLPSSRLLKIFWASAHLSLSKLHSHQTGYVSTIYIYRQSKKFIAATVMIHNSNCMCHKSAKNTLTTWEMVITSGRSRYPYITNDRGTVPFKREAAYRLWTSLSSPKEGIYASSFEPI